MGRRPLPKRITALTLRYYAVLATLSGSYSPLRGRYQRVTHPFATRSEDLVRLACIRHAASVHPEPGSNSPNMSTRSKVVMPIRRWGLGCLSLALIQKNF